ncbi:DNA metabolism protein [Raoultella ornithinolytica]|nr:DNA metabolism protein [Raoultella sp. X13]PJF13584.1 DNA metabolism protein [Raoultella ornithinolytica]PJO29770.1 DNA metabolism protein [Raoultella ornithinolytica]PQH16808.1 DNA metabolism protein [Raoultella ornithinolytica]PQH29447.1 DNA metabolism protein [Raoultella ornithinolytica]
MTQGSAHHPHLLRVRSGDSALSAARLAATRLRG